jgi:hypothetical protein
MWISQRAQHSKVSEALEMLRLARNLQTPGVQKRLQSIPAQYSIAKVEVG